MATVADQKQSKQMMFHLLFVAGDIAELKKVFALAEEMFSNNATYTNEIY